VPNKKKTAQNVVLGFIAAGLCLYAWCAVLAFYHPSGSYIPPVKMVGQNAVVDNGGPMVMLATTEAALEDLSKARIAGDKMGIFQVMAEGRAFPVDSKTKILVLDTTFTLRKVRVLEGPHLGKAGWVPMEWVK
jgi:hypothetical protein